MAVMDVSEEDADDGVIHAFNELTPLQQEALRPFAGAPDPGWGQLRYVVQDPE